MDVEQSALELGRPPARLSAVSRSLNSLDRSQNRLALVVGHALVTGWDSGSTARLIKLTSETLFFLVVSL